MSKLYSLRREIRDLLLADGWSADEVIIKRRTNIWNDVAVATGASKHGQCLVIGVAKGTNTARNRGSSKRLHMDVTVPITMIELPTVDLAQPDEGDEDEDDRWEAMCLLLQGEALGRSAIHYELEFDSFEDVEDDSYVIRQTVFKTRLVIKI